MQKYRKKSGFCLFLLLLVLALWGKKEDRRSEETGVLPMAGVEVQNVDVKNSTVPPIVTETDFRSEFMGYEGTAVYYCPVYNQYYIYQPDRSVVRMSPEQTFHLIAALLSLDLDIQSPSSQITWKEALQASSDWYFEETLEQVNTEQLVQALKTMGYGNCRIGERSGKTFWNDGTLKISAEEQVVLLSRIFEKESIFRTKDSQALRESLPKQTCGSYQTAGISGGGEQAAWYLGTMTDATDTWYFAVCIDNRQGRHADGGAAFAVASQIIASNNDLFFS